MELVSHEHLDTDATPEANLPSYSYCPNCFNMMNEIMELRMELGRVNESEKKVKKNFAEFADSMTWQSWEQIVLDLSTT